jgi:PKD repeat protein
MTLFSGLFRGLAAIVPLLALGIFAAAAVPNADFSMTPPGNPVVGQAVQFTDKSEGAPTSWLWNFGDGTISTQQSPIHSYALLGNYTVTLTATNGQGSSVPQDGAVVVSPSTVLRLNAPHPFEVTILAEDPATANTDTGRAIPQNDVFGYFTFPVLVPPDPDPAKVVPEVFVKLLDATSIGQNYWVFYGGLTSLKYTLTIKEFSTGITKTYVKPGFPDPASASGGFDTSGFHPAPGATATPTPAPTPTPTPGSAVRIVTVGGSDDQYIDSQSGTHNTSIHVGDTVKWVWIGNMHSTTAGTCPQGGICYDDCGVNCNPSGLWDSGLQVPPTTFSRTFTSAGTFKYFCMKHGYMMTGTVVVQP